MEVMLSASTAGAGGQSLFEACSNNLRICRRVERVTYEFTTPMLTDDMNTPECWRYEPFNGKPLVLRAEPRVDGPPTAHELKPGETFSVDQTQRAGQSGVLFMRLADGRGWAFEHVVTVGDQRGLMCVPAEAAVAERDLSRPDSFRAGYAFSASMMPAQKPIEDVAIPGWRDLPVATERGWIPGAVPVGTTDHMFEVGERVRVLDIQSTGRDAGGTQLAYSARDEGTVVFVPDFETVLTVRWNSGNTSQEITSGDVEEKDLVVGSHLTLKHDIPETPTLSQKAKGETGIVEAISASNIAVAFDKRKAEELPFVWVMADQLEAV